MFRRRQKISEAKEDNPLTRDHNDEAELVRGDGVSSLRGIAAMAEDGEKVAAVLKESRRDPVTRKGLSLDQSSSGAADSSGVHELKAGSVSGAVPLEGVDLDDRLIDQPASCDRRAILERNEEIGKKLLAGKLSRDIYHGREAYAPILNRREGAIAANKYTGSYGPLRASGAAFTRITTRMDYNPEICKDYNETGYCGFGDTCKFIHDRYDYKAGWQLENEWEKAQKKKDAVFKARLAGKKVEEGADDSGSDYD